MRPVAVRRLTRSSAAAAVLALMVGCSSAGTGKSTAALTASDPWKSVSVTGTSAVPALALAAKPFKVTKTTTKVVTQGKGAAVTNANTISANYLLVDGQSGKTLDTSFGKSATGIDLSSAQLMSGLSKGLIGQHVGSRVLVGIPPAEAFGAQGNTQLGVAATDSIIFLVDVVAAVTPLTTATGTAVAPKAGLPVIAMHGTKIPTVAIPKSGGKTATAPKSLVSQQLVIGKGAKVKAGQTIKVQYAGWIWSTGKVFDASYTSGQAATFPIGVKQVIPGWDTALVGQPVGSRVLLVVPPAEGYGAAGSTKDASGKQAITGKDTLVFVVDILSAV